MPEKIKATESGLEFAVHGDLDMKLKFMVGGKHVTLFIDGDEGLVIELDGGARFNIPVKEHKKAS